MADTSNGDQAVAGRSTTSADQSKPVNYLQKLPAELIACIAGHTDKVGIKCTDENVSDKKKKKDSALHALRLTCKSFYGNSLDEWLARHVRSLRARLAAASIERIIDILGSAGVLGKVKELELLDWRTKSGNVDELYCLLKSFCQHLSGLESIQIWDLNRGYRDLIPSPEAASAYRALVEAEPPMLSDIEIHGCHLSSSLFFSLLRKYTSTLCSLKIAMATFDNDKEMDTFLAIIRDELRLDKLVLDGLRIGPSFAPNALHPPLSEPLLVMEREDGCFRAKGGGKLQNYSLGNYWVRVSGQHAVKLAVNKAFRRRESKLYDPGMTRESPGL
ncbi:hypothetical protein BST61_g4189 [Cercospora zeina]